MLLAKLMAFRHIKKLEIIQSDKGNGSPFIFQRIYLVADNSYLKKTKAKSEIPTNGSTGQREKAPAEPVCLMTLNKLGKPIDNSKGENIFQQHLRNFK